MRLARQCKVRLYFSCALQVSVRIDYTSHAPCRLVFGSIILLMRLADLKKVGGREGVVAQWITCPEIYTDFSFGASVAQWFSSPPLDLHSRNVNTATDAIA
ncbi:hypothetical protein PoB_007235600 [Plakobranchus ocellatus]|uniref:Uncharacterized protein n=1 Tax=Plakobranchus ocellatus TaxID=259542 RepID=A0AAV4DPM6_9GAST|nr:hypothetical protein PoB_007235600 [Plakobranchus ocellatus]